MIPVSRLYFLFLGLCPLGALAGEGLQFSGNSIRVLSVEPEVSTGLEKIYVAYNLQGVSASYESVTPVKWLRFSNLGGAFAEEVPGIVHDGDRWVLPAVDPDMGYIVETSDGRRHCFWIVGYADKRLSLRSASEASVQDCDASIIEVDGSGDPIRYYTVLGQLKTLSRDIRVDYNTLQWDDSRLQFDLIPVSETFAALSTELRLVPPALCQTSFTVSGDRFLREWDWEQSVSTGTVMPSAVAVKTAASQPGVGGENSNVIKTGEGETLGGSAPVTVSFRAWVSDGVVHNEWQMDRNPDFPNPEYRFNQQDLDFTFQEEGTWFVRFAGSNSNGSCTAYGDVYTVSLGASDLRIPNAFSPNGDGVNDEWKVAYRSLLEFECWIVDRYGNPIKHFTTPQEGWDGKRGGKPVAPGVYYYVITAKGSDGKKYKESGDINIIRSVSQSDRNEQ